MAVENQFMNELRISSILNQTQLETLCASNSTIGVILDLKSNTKLPFLKNVILFDNPEDIHIALATQVGLNIYSFYDMVSEGF